MTDRELDARLGELIGLDVHRDMPCFHFDDNGDISFLAESDIEYENEADGNEHAYRPDPEEFPNWYEELPHYSTDLNAVREVEIRVFEMGKIDAYLLALNDASLRASLNANENSATLDSFFSERELVFATARQRAEALVEALEGEDV